MRALRVSSFYPINSSLTALGSKERWALLARRLGRALPSWENLSSSPSSLRTTDEYTACLHHLSLTALQINVPETYYEIPFTV